MCKPSCVELKQLRATYIVELAQSTLDISTNPYHGHCYAASDNNESRSAATQNGSYFIHM